MSTPQQPYGAPQYGGAPDRPPYGGPPPAPGYGPPPGHGTPPGYGYPGPAQPPYAQPGPVPPPAYGYPGPQPAHGGPGGTPPLPPPAGPGMPAGLVKSRRGLRFWARTGVLALGAVILVVALFSDSTPGSKVGDCLHRSTTTTRVTDVPCSDPQANYRVVKRVNSGLTSSCNGTPGVTASYRGSYGRRWHRKHYVLCLAPYSAAAGTPGAGASPKNF